MTTYTREQITEAWKKASRTTEHTSVSPGHDWIAAFVDYLGLTVEDPKPAPGWYFTDDGTVARVRANKHTGKPMLYVDDGSDRVRLRDEEWPALTPAYVVPVEEWQAITCKAQEQEQAIRDLRKARDEWEEAAYSSRRATDALANRLASTRVVPAEPVELTAADIDPLFVEHGNGYHLTTFGAKAQAAIIAAMNAALRKHGTR